LNQVNIPDVPSLYQLLQQQFGLGVNDVKHGFTDQGHAVESGQYTGCTVVVSVTSAAVWSRRK
ncbi:hypothetical protein VS872_22605, partial [Salmonella enterica subsp. enterica serovar Paratyphi A]|nr:hypothetical protein [Salmonella enterica subsp. enterica serovar Paratyphi A]